MLFTRCLWRRLQRKHQFLPFYPPAIENNVSENDSSSNSIPLELTLSIIKPDVSKHPYSLRVIRKIILDNFLIVQTKYVHLTKHVVENFYKEHQGKFFYNRLITFMSSGPVFIHILAKHNAISYWRKLMGPTKTYRAIYEAPWTIRGFVGLTDTRNATHGSDSIESAYKEIQFFFPDFNIEEWYNTEEIQFRQHSVIFNEKLLIHESIPIKE